MPRRLGSVLPGLAAFAAVAGFAAAALIALLAAAPGPAGTAGAAVGADRMAYLWQVGGFTLLQAGLSTLLAVVPAVPVALALSRHPDWPGRELILRLFALPFALPALVAVLGLVTVLGRTGWLNTVAEALGLPPFRGLFGLGGILIAHVFFNLPLAVRMLVAQLDRVPPESWRLAAQLGMGRTDMLRLIEGPALRAVLPGIVALVFLLCVTSFTVVMTLGGGPGATTLEVAIYQALRFDFDPALAVRLALLQLAVCAVLVLATETLAVNADQGDTLGRGGRLPVRGGPLAWLLDRCVVLAAVVLVMLPLLAVVTAGLAADLGRIVRDPLLWQALGTSILVAGLSSALALALSLMLLESARRLATGFDQERPLRWLGSAMARLPALSLLMPSTLLGAGWFVLLIGRVDPATAGPPLLIAINAMLALPYAMRALAPAIEDSGRRHDRLCASLGIAGWTRFRLIDWPSLEGAARQAAAMAVLVSLGDLGAVALFGSESLMTLPFLLYQRLGSYRTTDAAAIALVLMGLALLLALVVESGRRRTASR